MNEGSTKTAVLGRIGAQHSAIPITSVLVVGCGSGRECQTLASTLDADVSGVDPNAKFAALESLGGRVTLYRDPAERLHHASQSFDMVYCYHVLEHVHDARAALREMRRVLRTSGLLVIGVPNRRRLVGYLFSGASVSEFWRWNATDWRARFYGRFQNHLGVHAGFTERELETMLREVFGDVRCISREYYRGVYPRWRALLSVLEATRASVSAYPSVYFVASDNRSCEDPDAS